MATTTPNFGWSVPTSTDLVKDGATAIETLGDSIDASLVDLKGGTTGQVLAKNSNTDMDFVWSADASGIPASAFTAKGNLLVGTGASTYAAQTVGANGTVLTADSAEADGVKWAAVSATKSFALLSTTSLSSTITTVSGLSGYDDFLVIIEQATLTSGNSDLRWRFNGNTGSVYTQAGSKYTNGAAYGTNLGGATGRFASTAMDAGKANSTTGGYVHAALSIRGANSAGLKILSGDSGNVDSGGSGGENRSWQGFYSDTDVISSISFLTLASTFSAGTIYVYGAV
jgi:hypothetical protein